MSRSAEAREPRDSPSRDVSRAPAPVPDAARELASGEESDGPRVGTPEAAAPADVFEVAGLLRAAAPDCVPQSPRQVREHLDGTVVVRRGGRVVGCASLRPLDPGRAELRGVATAPSVRGRGLGPRLVRALLGRAATSGVRVVCVTRRPGFFEHLGFRPIPLESVPGKPGVGPVSGGPPRVALAYGTEGAADQARAQ